MPAALGGIAANHGAKDDGDEGGAFDERVARRQLLGRQVIGQDAVLHRPEEGGDHAEQEERQEQQRQRMEGEACDSHRGGADLGELQPLRHHGLVELVGELAAQCREDQEGQDEDGAGEADQSLPFGSRHLEQDQEDDRVLQDVVSEGREELGPEQRRETTRGEKLEHERSFSGSLRARTRETQAHPGD